MWYVISAVIGKEDNLCEWMKAYLDKSTYTRCFVAKYEEVRKKDGIVYIKVRNLFDGYFFLETEYPDAVLEQLKRTDKVSALMSTDANGHKELIAIQEGEELFLDQVLENGLLKVSYIRRNEDREIVHLIGPLEKYRDSIEKLDTYHRKAIVKVPMLRQEMRVKFGLWMDYDPEIEWIEEEKRQRGIV